MRCWFVLLIAACGGYRAGSYTSRYSSFAGQRGRAGCVDVAVQAYRPDDAALVSDPKYLVEVALGNGCMETTRVELRRLAVTVTTADGHELPLEADPSLVDPVDIVFLEGHDARDDLLSFVAPEATPARVCVEYGRIVAGAGDIPPACWDAAALPERAPR